jgi:phenylacetate-coenzyme A ligase PaaK-like adenylate-forming protein
MTTATRAETSWGRFRADLQAELLARTPEHLERLSWGAERIESAQRDGLRRLLAHAVAHSPFHRRRLAGMAVADIEPADLVSLPVMTKNDMMAAIDDVFTDRRLTLGAIDQTLAGTGSEPVPVLGRYMALATGGSTGQRGRVRLRSGREGRVHPLDHPEPAGPASRGRRDPTGRAAFGTPVTNSFASTEGLMGTSAPGGDVLAFNDDMCIIELVDADNRPVGPGVPSAKVLVTNLYNLTQPPIRYELSDSFVHQPGAPGTGHLLARVQGRADEVFHYQGGDLHPHVIRSVMVRSPEVADYQVRQTRTGIEADVIAAAGGASTEALRRQLAGALAHSGLSRPDVTVRVTGDLARNAGSGKLRRFVPLSRVA